MFSVNSHRLVTSLRQLATFTVPGPAGSVTRLPWTAEDKGAVDWLQGAMENAGLICHVDPIGNLWGIWDVDASSSIVLGSHRDSVPTGGQFDGALGVIGALEVLIRLKESGYRPTHNLEMVAWNDEEGARFGTTLFGSRVYVGALDPRSVRQYRDKSGMTLQEAVNGVGLSLDAMKASDKLERMASYLELHIEQGPILEREGRSIGIVNGVGGLFQWRVTLTGTRLHAAYSGIDRLDPVLQASRLLSQLQDQVRMINAHAEWAKVGATVGMVELSSHLINVVPEQLSFTLDLRGPEPSVPLAVFEAVERELQAIQTHTGLSYEVVALNDHTTLAGSTDRLHPVAFDAALGDMIDDAAAEAGYEARPIMSWAGHDAMAMAPRVPTAMIFVPSYRGLSHTPTEYTSDDDAIRGANTLLKTVLRVDGGL